MERKPDAARIEAHLDRLREAGWLGVARQWWPKFVFRFDDIQNVVRILTAGKVRCRSQRGEALETASQEVLGNTEEKWKDCVRLYFRPRTPTQYQVEGFRPKGQLGSLRAHMPVPVFLLFDAKQILTRKATQFSTGNLAANPVVGDTAGFFETIPFENGLSRHMDDRRRKAEHQVSSPCGNHRARGDGPHRTASDLVPVRG